MPDFTNIKHSTDAARPMGADTSSLLSASSGIIAPASGSREPLFNWLTQRAAGVLMHPTSLPGAQGIGVLSDDAIDPWLAFLGDAGFRYWQVCPLGPTGYGDSPYQCFSAFAGNPYLIDLQVLQKHGLLESPDIAPLTALPRDHVDFGWLYAAKWKALHRAYENFSDKTSITHAAATTLPYGDYDEFLKKHADWLEPYALFQALKEHHNPLPWWSWPEEIRFYDKARAAALPRDVLTRAKAHAFFQYLFHGQWARVRAKAARLGIEIIGDAPIFVARDSADVWANPELFQIDENTGEPLAVAGVPPDYFSADGQLWGNPLYAWEKHAATGYAWWIRRLAVNFELCDVLRLDHFRGFDTYWSIPADAPTAKTGEWQQGPGLALFEKVRAALPRAKIIAEDLGELMPSVIELRDATGLPGMVILQFAFGGQADNLYLPHNHHHNSVVYPGTHDNDTTLGWYRAADNESAADHVRRYLRVNGSEIGWDFVRSAYASVSNLAVIPLQDLMSLGGEARFNTPGVAAGNWQWRYTAQQLETLHRESAGYLKSIGELYGR
ncbi:4-alpha-glucanotransferase [Ereboglobus sp. PH5-5]|uniref:4-alpha-glucanotransferase n=1 Tax=Ereboglobus sp. PH5-5 TaxID=2940529 RepID=UPI0024073490|nr:4-alpha-glucanotransferase [Ereboglobus sp. PH5-5]MDF9832716.1 4-alpha-glucanotransferase [Ereboglobus sp. PH5-5]